jgi:uncharacterized protein YdaU (DUF1376 family)
MNPPKMPIHIGDYKRDTGHLRAAEHGAYLLLLFHHWSTGGLPDDDRQLSAIACMSAAEWRKAKPILIKFFGEGWRHGRVEKDLVEAKESYEKRAAAGSEGGKAKARGKQSSSKAVALLPDDPSNALPTFNHLPKKEDITPDGVSATGKVYAFEDGIIRLNKRDFDAWTKAFSHLDLSAELLSLSKWTSEQGDKWFHALKGALAKRNRDVKIEKERLAEQGGFKWNGGMEGVI